MKKNLIYCIYPKKAQDIDFKNYYGVINLMGRLFSIWNKKKQPLKIKKSFLLENIKHLTKNTLWLYLKELCDKNVISISKENYDNNTIIINFTDNFIKNYVNADEETETEPEDIEEIDNEDIEEQEEADNKNVKYTPAQLQMIEENKKYGLVGDDYLPVEGWANTDRQDFRGLLKKYGGKVPEIPEEVLNFDFGKIKREDYPKESYITSEGYIYTYDSYYEQFLLSFKIKEFIKLRENKELMLFDWLSFYDTIMEIWGHLKSKGLV